MDTKFRPNQLWLYDSENKAYMKFNNICDMRIESMLTDFNESKVEIYASLACNAQIVLMPDLPVEKISEEEFAEILLGGEDE